MGIFFFFYHDWEIFYLKYIKKKKLFTLYFIHSYNYLKKLYIFIVFVFIYFILLYFKEINTYIYILREKFSIIPIFTQHYKISKNKDNDF